MSYCNIGVDLSVTAKHQAQVCDEQGKKIVPKFSFSLTKAELDTLCQQAQQEATAPTVVRFICEPTAMAWFPLAIYAKTHKHKFIRVKAHKAHDLRQYYSRHRKNDTLDAGILAKIPLIDEKAMEEVYLPDAKTFALERRNRQKNRIRQEISAGKNRLRSLYHWLMPGLMNCFADPFDSRGRTFYRHFTNPFQAKAAGPDGIRQVLEHASRQKMPPDLPEKLYAVAGNACELYTQADHWVDFQEIHDEVQIELELLENLEETLTKVQDRVDVLYQKIHPSRVIESLKGIGPSIGASVLGALGNPQRFSAQKKLRAFVGIIPKQDDSGERAKKGLALTQEGPARLRRDVFLAADVARQYDPQLAQVYYHEMVNKGHCHTQAVCAVIPRLLNRTLCVLKENRPYELRDTAGNKIEPAAAKRIIQAQFTVPEEIRQRTRSRRRRQNKKEEQLRNLFQRQLNAPQNSYPVPPRE
jgi:transposase